MGRFWISVFFVAALALWVVPAFYFQPTKDQKVNDAPEDPLIAISGHVYIMKINAEVERSVSCGLSEFNNRPNGDESRDKEIEIVIQHAVQNAQAECKFWQKVWNEVDPLYAKIVDEESVPNGLYYFTIVDGDLENTIENKWVGLFLNNDSCEVLARQYRDTGGATTNCEEWTGQPRLW